MEEQWKPIERFVHNEVSNLGRVRSLTRKSHTYGGRYRLFHGTVLSLIKSTRGYPSICLRLDGKIKSLAVHRLVATAFIPNHENKPCVNHKNGIKNDNRVENLEWCSFSENHLHAYATGLRKKNKPESSITTPKPETK